MENEPLIKKIELTVPETLVEIKKMPLMGFIFIKAFWLSLFRSSAIEDDLVVKKNRIMLKHYRMNKDLIAKYRTICDFSPENPEIIPISYLQTLFNGLLGRFITSSFFPINPLGLIHIFQSFDQKRAVATDEIIDLACTLDGINKTPKGIETRFSLEILSQGRLVWQGVSVFFTRAPVRTAKTGEKKEEKHLDERETIAVTAGTGRKYARVSGDYNPHHLYPVFAKLFGFKRAIAHGMWSLARVAASLDREFGIGDATFIEAYFKLPVFMPAQTTLGYEHQKDAGTGHTIVNFELRDKFKGLPHIKGRLIKTGSR